MERNEQTIGLLKINEQVEKAREILERNFFVFGPEEVEKTFGFNFRNASNTPFTSVSIPPIPFSTEELENARRLNQMLVLRVDRTAEGKPMSIKAINNMMTKKLKKESRGGRFIYSDMDDWIKLFGRDLVKQETPRIGWALTTKDILPGSLGKNYLEQTELIAQYIKKEVFRDLEIPEVYLQAIQEFEDEKEFLGKIIETDWKEAAKELAELKINQMTRQSLTEAVYDLALYYDISKKKLLEKYYTWTTSRSLDGGLGVLNDIGDAGLDNNWFGPDLRGSDLGVSFSRRL